MFNSWEVFNIPFILIPCFTILLFTEKRITLFRKQMYLKTLDGLVDVLTEKLVFLYISVIFIKSLFGGVTDFSFIEIESFIPIFEIATLVLKLFLIVITVAFLLRFTPIKKNEVNTRVLSMPTCLLLLSNLLIVVYFRGIM